MTKKSTTTNGSAAQQDGLSPYEAVEQYFAKGCRAGVPETRNHVNTNNLWMRIACAKGMYGPIWKKMQYDSLPPAAKKAIRAVEDDRPELMHAALAYTVLREIKFDMPFDKWSAKRSDKLEITEEDFAGEALAEYIAADGLRVVNAKLGEADGVLAQERLQGGDLASRRSRAIHYAGSAIMDEIFRAMDRSVTLRPEIAIALVK